jgi:hypothetical protein
VLEKQAGRRKKIKDAGIDYDFEGHVSAACCRSSSSWGFVVAFLEGMRADQISEVDGVKRSGVGWRAGAGELSIPLITCMNESLQSRCREPLVSSSCGSPTSQESFDCSPTMEQKYDRRCVLCLSQVLDARMCGERASIVNASRRHLDLDSQTINHPTSTPFALRQT